MKIFNFIVLLLFAFSVKAQETFLNNSFAVRDFFLKKNSIFLIEKRDVKYFNYSKENSPIQSYFIGGYGLEIFDDSENNEVITVSNEFHRTVSTLRFFNKSSKKVEHVYYYHEGKSIDALILPELKYAAMSLNNNKIMIVNYTKKPSFKVEHEIQLKAMARRLIYKNDFLFYVTDLGEIYKYSLKTKENTLLFDYDKKITDFAIFNNAIIYSTIDGEIIKYNTIKKSVSKIQVKDNFVLNSLHFKEDKLVCGTFKGSIILLDIEKMTIIKELQYHKRSVNKIVNYKNNAFYSSSIDKTIRKWTLN